MDIVLDQDHAAPADHIGQGGFSALGDHDGGGITAGGTEKDSVDGLQSVLCLQFISQHPFAVSRNGNELQMVHFRQFNKIDKGVSVHCDPVSRFKEGKKSKGDGVQRSGCNGEMVRVSMDAHILQPVYCGSLVVGHSCRILIVQKF